MLIKIPNLLAIDSSSSLTSISLQYNSKVSSKVIENTRHQASSILSKIDELLKENQIKLDNIDAYVLSNGPGRFTGLRIATSCIQGLAFCSNKKIVLIDSLKLLAQQYAIATNSLEKIIWVCQKAYNKVYYLGKFRFDKAVNVVSSISEKSIAVTQESLVKSLQLLSAEQINQISLVGNGWNDLSYNSSAPIYCSEFDSEPHVKYIFSLANIEYQCSNMLDAAEIAPEYIVNPYSQVH